jgi:hypothetical protein
MNMSYGHHVSLSSNIPHYNWCRKVIDHFTTKHHKDGMYSGKSYDTLEKE